MLRSEADTDYLIRVDEMGMSAEAATNADPTLLVHVNEPEEVVVLGLDDDHLGGKQVGRLTATRLHSHRQTVIDHLVRAQ